MNSRLIVGVLGFIGSGKGTVGSYLTKYHGFVPMSFAASLKDAVADIFHWPRDLLEGSTTESRSWREQEDPYWSAKMSRSVTPRWVLQHLGTDIMRSLFFDDIWIASLEKNLMIEENHVVITDVRFPNEIKMIKEQGGQLWWVQRGELPVWYECAVNYPNEMPTKYPMVHESEYKWIGQDDFKILYNNSSIDELYDQVSKLL